MGKGSMARYSVSQWIYGREPIENSLERLARYGYDGVELAGEPRSTDVTRVKQLLSDNGLVVSSICGLYRPERDLSHSDPQVRREAVQYVKECVDLAAETGAEVVIVVPSPVAKPAPTSPIETELDLAAESLREAGEYAGSQGVTLVLEALNRFETYLTNKIDKVLALAGRVDLPSVAIMVDAFHMNIEEASLPDTIRRADGAVRHVHIADSNRESVGRGHIDFRAFVEALNQIGYSGWYTMEFLPPTSNPYLAAEYEADQHLFDVFTKESIERMRAIIGT